MDERQQAKTLDELIGAATNETKILIDEHQAKDWSDYTPVGDKFNYKKLEEMMRIRNISYSDLYEYACIYEKIIKHSVVTFNKMDCDLDAYYDGSFKQLYSGRADIAGNAYKGTLSYSFVKACAVLMQCDVDYFFNEENNSAAKEKIVDKQEGNDFTEGITVEPNKRRDGRSINRINWKNVYSTMEIRGISFEILKEFIGIPLNFDKNELSNFKTYRYGTAQTIAWLLDVPRSFIANDYNFVIDIDIGRYINIYQTFMLDGSKIGIVPNEVLSESLNLPIRIVKYLKSGTHQININIANKIANTCEVKLEDIRSDKPITKYNYWDNSKYKINYLHSMCPDYYNTGDKQFIACYGCIHYHPSCVGGCIKPAFTEKEIRDLVQGLTNEMDRLTKYDIYLNPDVGSDIQDLM